MDKIMNMNREKQRGVSLQSDKLQASRVPATTIGTISSTIGAKQTAESMTATSRTLSVLSSIAERQAKTRTERTEKENIMTCSKKQIRTLSATAVRAWYIGASI